MDPPSIKDKVVTALWVGQLPRELGIRVQRLPHASAFPPGGNPFNGQAERPNVLNHLTGGNQFGPFTSANLTPDGDGLPAGLTLQAFIALMRTGLTDDHPQFGPVLQVMPWPTFRKMTDRDLAAIYEYLRAIPSRPDNPNPGECCPEE